MTEALLVHGADPGNGDEAGNTALHVALLCRQHAVAAALLGRMRRQEIHQRNGKGASALFEAVHREDAIMVRQLIQAGACVDDPCHDAWSTTPLMLAAMRGNAAMVRELLACWPRALTRASRTGRLPPRCSMPCAAAAWPAPMRC